MKIAVIICEYNPLQNGHIYHITQTKKVLGADKVVCIMSGNFTQRGELAVADKYTRSIWAIKSGADMVIELPPQYVLTTAKYFALGGVKIANNIKGDVFLSFGSELGDLTALKEVASFQENDDFKIQLEKQLQSGKGYAKSYSDALAKSYPKYNDILSTPNNILAVEYLKALKFTNSSITPYTIARVGGGYHQTDAKEYPSASCIRCLWQDGNLQTVSKEIPQYVYDYLKDCDPNNLKLANDKIFSLLKFSKQLNLQTSSIHGMKEGIENRIANAVKISNNWQELTENLSTKRYTNAYLYRTLTNLLLHNDYSKESLENNKISFVNILAVEKNSKGLLSCFDCDVVTKSQDLPTHLINTADNLYSSVKKNMPCHMQIVEREF